MALDWEKRSGKSTLDGFSRSLARKGLDILDITGVTNRGKYKHNSRRLIEGVIRNRVEETLGSKTFHKICNQRTVLENIHYCQSGLSFVDGLRNPQKVVPVPGESTLGDAIVAAPSSFLNHDYLVVEIGYGNDDKLFIRAEKTGHSPEKAGILLTVDPNYEETEQSVHLFTIECRGKELGLPEILDILADHSPDYSLRDHNCWQYTRRTARRLLHRCKEEGLSAEELSRLQAEEDTIESRIATSHLKRAVHNGKQGVKNIWSKAFG